LESISKLNTFSCLPATGSNDLVLVNEGNPAKEDNDSFTG
jgi:hypothetical protein